MLFILADEYGDILFAKYNENDEIEEDTVGKACRMHNRDIAYRVLVVQLERKCH